MPEAGMDRTMDPRIGLEKRFKTSSLDLSGGCHVVDLIREISA
jgi:hypothetical protein